MHTTKHMFTYHEGTPTEWAKYKQIEEAYNLVWHTINRAYMLGTSRSVEITQGHYDACNINYKAFADLVLECDGYQPSLKDSIRSITLVRNAANEIMTRIEHGPHPLTNDELFHMAKVALTEARWQANTSIALGKEKEPECDYRGALGECHSLHCPKHGTEKDDTELQTRLSILEGRTR